MQKLQVVFMRWWTEVIYIPLEPRVQKTIRRTNTCLSFLVVTRPVTKQFCAGYFGHLKLGIIIVWLWRKAPCSCSLDTDLTPGTGRQPSANNPTNNMMSLLIYQDLVQAYRQQPCCGIEWDIKACTEWWSCLTPSNVWPLHWTPGLANQDHRMRDLLLPSQKLEE